jgi:type III secretion protein C
VLLALLVATAGAEPIPFGKGTVDITAREQPIAGFLQDLLGTAGVRVSVSASVTGAVNGRFSGTVENVYRQVARAFNLVEYHDGSVLHIGTPHELLSRALSVDTAGALRVGRAVQDLGMADARNRVRTAGDGTVVVTGHKRFVEQVEELARLPRPMSQADRLPSPMGLRVFYLRYAWAQDVQTTVGGRPTVVPGVASMVRSLMGAPPRPAADGTPAGTPSAAAGVDTPARAAGPRGSVSGAGRDATLGLPGALARQPSAPVLLAAAARAADPRTGPGLAPAETAAADAPPARIEADGRLNAVLVRDAAERLPVYESLIQALDIEPMAVEIEATLIDVNTDRLRQLGIQWRYTQGRTSLLFGRGDASDLLLSPATPVADITPSAAGGFASAVLGNASQFIARINALESQGAARVVSSPQVLTLSNVEAVFDSSQTFYVRVAGRDAVDLFNVSAGTTLRVTPHVFKEGEESRIKMRVSIEDGALSTRTVDTLPVVDRASISTQAMIFEGESLLVGGITRDSRNEAETRVPFLADLPWVGGLFRHRQAQSERLERLFLITPRLAPARRPAATPAALAFTAASAHPAAPAFLVQDTRGARESYLANEAYAVEVAIPRDGFMYCYLLDAQRQWKPFFPNAARRGAAVSSGTTILPGAQGFRLLAPPGPGQETVDCFLVDKDLGHRPLDRAGRPRAGAEGPGDLAADMAALKARFEHMAGGPVDAAEWAVRVH